MLSTGKEWNYIISALQYQPSWLVILVATCGYPSGHDVWVFLSANHNSKKHSGFCEQHPYSDSEVGIP